MPVYFEHTYRDGTSVRFLTKPFEPAKKEVPTIEFNFVQGGALRTLNTRLYDADEKQDFAQEFYDAVGKYLGKDGDKVEPETADVAGTTNGGVANVGGKIVAADEAVFYPENVQFSEPNIKPVPVEKPKKKFNLKKKKCIDCGNEYMPTSGAQQRCDECKRKRNDK